MGFPCAPNTFDNFTVLFWQGNVLVGKESRPLGQYTTDFLNLDEEALAETDKRVADFLPAYREVLKNKNGDEVYPMQGKLNAVYEDMSDLPFYRDVPMDKSTIRNLFLLMQDDKALWDKALTEGTDKNKELWKMHDRIEYFTESLRNFRGQISGMLELYFEDLPRRNSAEYAKACARYFSEMSAAGGLSSADYFEQSFPSEIKFRPARIPAHDGEIVLAEAVEFTCLSHFLYTDFYRGLIAGNAPRRCHNCRRFFLLSKGYNTCYCNNIAPGETDKTCRRVGAHKKVKEKSQTDPAIFEYRKVYNRLKARKHRGKISTDQWNAAVALALEYMEKAQAGEMSELELREVYEGF